MNILIYGSTGFVGRYIVKQLYGKANLILPVRNIEKANSIFFKYKDLKFVKISEENIEKPILDRNPDLVINLIGILKETENQTFEKVHYQTSKRLIDTSKKVGVKKFIQMSALGADINSKSRYQKTKAMAEDYLIKSSINYIIFRLSIIIGKEQKLFYDLKKYSKIAPFFFAPYDVKVQPVHVLDVAECFEKATFENIKNEIFELCGEKVISFKQLFDFALKYLNIKRPIIPVPKKFFRFLIPFFSLMPEPIMTLDQYYMLEKDNICSGKYKGVKDLLGKVRDFSIL